MSYNYIFAEIILFENSIFASIAASKKMLNACSERCRNSIKKGPDFNYKVQCCTSACKIKSYTKMITSLQSLKNNSVSVELINKKISYFSNQLQKEKMKYKRYRQQLKLRQTKIPVHMSLKPSPERWDPKSFN